MFGPYFNFNANFILLPILLAALALGSATRSGTNPAQQPLPNFEGAEKARLSKVEPPKQQGGGEGGYPGF